MPHRTSFIVSPEGAMITSPIPEMVGNWVAIGGSQSTITTTWQGLIDLSDTVNWPHDSSGFVEINCVRLTVDKSTAARGSVNLGVITRVNNVSADITFIGSANFLENDTPAVDIFAPIYPSDIKTEMVAGALARIKTSGVLTNVTAVNTGVLLAPFNFTPAVGDIVVRILTTTGGNLNYTVGVNYNSRPLDLA